MTVSEKTGLVLEGMRVIDFSRLLPGPWNGQLLGDLGADVIKVEQIGVGDPSRHNPPSYAHASVYFHSVNGNKRGIAIDVREPEGRELVTTLIRGADVVIESFRPGVARRLGIDYETVREYNPGIVYASFSGYGQTGPLAEVPGHDLVIQAMSGHMGAPGADAGDEKPGVPSFQAADYAGASMGAIGLLAALMKKQQTGEGTYLDISLFDSLLYMSKVAHTQSLKALHSGEPVDPENSPKMEVYGGNPRYATYATADGQAVAVSFLEARVWAQFCQYIEREDLIDTAEAQSDRHTRHPERAARYREAIAGYCSSRTRDQLCEELEAQSIPVCPIYSPEEALAGSQAVARGSVKTVEHAQEGAIPLLSNPLRFSGLVQEDRVNSPGVVGQDTEAVLKELGVDQARYLELREKGIVA